VATRFGARFILAGPRTPLATEVRTIQLPCRMSCLIILGVKPGRAASCFSAA
jgi:hypothetical protein